MNDKEYWTTLIQATNGEDNEPENEELMYELAEKCSKYVKKLEASEELVRSAFAAIYNLQNRAALEYFLGEVEDPTIIRVIYEIDDTANADIGDPVGLSIAENIHTPKDILTQLYAIEFDQDYCEDQIRDSLKRNPSASFLFN